MFYYLEVIMIFFCFSGKDRPTIVKSIRYHLLNFGLECWYDNKDYILGCKKKEGYVQGINKSKYAIIFLSKHFFTSTGANEELEVIKKRYRENNIHIFPILYNISEDDIPHEYMWITELIYNDIYTNTRTLPTAIQIFNQVLVDVRKEKNTLTLSSIHSLNLSETKLNDCRDWLFIRKMLDDYYNINNFNLNAKFTILHSISVFLGIYLNQYLSDELREWLNKNTEMFFNAYKLNLKLDFKELIVFEEIIALCLNSIISM